LNSSPQTVHSTAESLTFREYFQMLVDAAGGTRSIDELDEEHPCCPTR
jgi:hypothetical protein